MKKASEYLKNVLVVTTEIKVHKNIIKQAQKDAYNQALEDAAENVEHLWDNNENELFEIDKQSILKLKKK